MEIKEMIKVHKHSFPKRFVMLFGILGAALLAFLAIAVRPSQAAVGDLAFTIEGPGVQSSQVTCDAGLTVENFDSLTPGGFASYASPIGSYVKGNFDFVIQAADQFGGAGGTGNYIRTPVENSYTLTLAQPAGYFGFYFFQIIGVIRMRCELDAPILV